jgi:hypothetical protein
MDLTELRRYRITLDDPFYNSESNGMALFDLATAFLGAYLLDITFKLSQWIPCKNKRLVYYLLVIPVGVIVHHIWAHVKAMEDTLPSIDGVGRGTGSFKLAPDELTFLNKKLFTLEPNRYHLFILLIIVLIYLVC